MAIPIGANLGGMGTPIGTPPNAFAYKVLNAPDGLNLDIGFGDWMMIMAPMVILMLVIGMVHHPQDVPILTENHRTAR